MQQLLSLTRAAVQKYDMIAPDSHVAVGVSGGKDSIALLVLLAQLRRFYPVPFSLTAVTLDPCFEGQETDFSPVAALCDRLEIPYVLRRTRLWEIVFEERRESNPCSLCARMRRGALHRAAVECGCDTVALGHHKDDVAETFLMNLLCGGTLGCFSPKSYLDRRQLTLIRPILLIAEQSLAAFVQRERLPIISSRCPVDGHTNRQQMKELAAELSRRYGAIDDKILSALQKADIDGFGCIADRWKGAEEA